MAGTELAATITAKEALNTFLAVGGDFDKALEKLSPDPRVKFPRDVFVRALAENAHETNQAIRTVMTLQSFDVTRQLNDMLATKIDELDGPDLVKAIQGMTSQVDSLTRTQNTPASGAGTNVLALLIQQLPREAGNAVKQLASLDMDSLHDMRRLLQLKEGKVVDNVEEADFRSL